MEEFRLDPEDLSFTLISNEKSDYKECANKQNEIKSIEFGKGYLKIYELKDRIQPSNYELNGKFFKRSNAHGYEEILVEDDLHLINFLKYSADDIERLLLIISERIGELKKYNIGENIAVSRYVNGHDYWDLVILPIPRHNIENCYVCESIKHIENREIYRTEQILAYIPFSPKKEEILVITTLRHTPIEDIDTVIAFDIANLIKKLISFMPQDITITIMEMADNHLEIKIQTGNVDPVDSLGIKRLNYYPEEMAKKMAEKLSDGK